MASPQTEDGFTRIANELLEAITKADLGKRELKIILAIARLTYGFGRKLAPVSKSQLAQATNLHLTHVCKTLQTLSDSGIVTCVDGEFGIIKDYDSWQAGLPKQSVTKTVISDQNSHLPKQSFVTETVSKSDQNSQLDASKAAPVADIQPPKERKKDSNSSTTIMRGILDLSDADRGRLVSALEGITIRPEDLAERFRVQFEKKVREGKASAAILDEFDAKPLDVRISWWCASLAHAREKCANRSAWMSWAAGVIVNAINNGIDLAGEAKQAPPPIPKHKYANRSWFYLYRLVDKADQDEGERQVREMVLRCKALKGDADLNAALVILREQGFESAADYVYRRYPPARNG